MPKLIAFLRAINVGGHTVKMDELRRIFESLGFSAVETFIASGNVIFETSLELGRALEQRIEDGLQEALGYPVATFIRTPAELAEIAHFQPFPQPVLDAAAALNIAFLPTDPTPEAIHKLMALRTEIDDFRAQGREFYWLCRGKQSESSLSGALFEKAMGTPVTMRGINTLRRLTAKVAA